MKIKLNLTTKDITMNILIQAVDNNHIVMIRFQ